MFAAGEKSEGPDWTVGGGARLRVPGQRAAFHAVRGGAVEPSPTGEREGETWAGNLLAMKKMFMISA